MSLPQTFTSRSAQQSPLQARPVTAIPTSQLRMIIAKAEKSKHYLAELTRVLGEDPGMGKDGRGGMWSWDALLPHSITSLQSSISDLTTFVSNPSLNSTHTNPFNKSNLLETSLLHPSRPLHAEEMNALYGWGRVMRSRPGEGWESEMEGGVESGIAAEGAEGVRGDKQPQINNINKDPFLLSLPSDSQLTSPFSPPPPPPGTNPSQPHPNSSLSLEAIHQLLLTTLDERQARLDKALEIVRAVGDRIGGGYQDAEGGGSANGGGFRWDRRLSVEEVGDGDDGDEDEDEDEEMEDTAMVPPNSQPGDLIPNTATTSTSFSGTSAFTTTPSSASFNPIDLSGGIPDESNRNGPVNGSQDGQGTGSVRQQQVIVLEESEGSLDEDEDMEEV